MIQDAPDVARRTADTVQYLIASGVVTLVALVWRLDRRQARVEAKLFDKPDGLISQMESVKKFRHWCRNVMWANHFRIRTLESAAGIEPNDLAPEFPEDNRQ